MQAFVPPWIHGPDLMAAYVNGQNLALKKKQLAQDAQATSAANKLRQSENDSLNKYRSGELQARKDATASEDKRAAASLQEKKENDSASRLNRQANTQIRQLHMTTQDALAKLKEQRAAATSDKQGKLIDAKISSLEAHDQNLMDKFGEFQYQFDESAAAKRDMSVLTDSTKRAIALAQGEEKIGAETDKAIGGITAPADQRTTAAQQILGQAAKERQRIGGILNPAQPTGQPPTGAGDLLRQPTSVAAPAATPPPAAPMPGLAAPQASAAPTPAKTGLSPVQLQSYDKMSRDALRQGAPIKSVNAMRSQYSLPPIPEISPP